VRALIHLCVLMLVLGAYTVAGAEAASDEALPTVSQSTEVVTRNMCDSTIHHSVSPVEPAGGCRDRARRAPTHRWVA
jgi:hypothetical protein